MGNGRNIGWRKLGEDTETVHIRMTKTMRANLSKAAHDASKDQGRYVSTCELVRGWIAEALERAGAEERR